MRPKLTSVLALLAVGSLGAAVTAADDRVAQARARYDLELAHEVLSALDRPDLEDPAAIEEVVQAALLVAELERIEFEDRQEEAGESRREIGDRIDEAARRGLDLLDRLDESSHTQRLRADLVGTLIRSKFRGKRYRGNMERAAARAIELDPENAAAHVSAAKPSLLHPGRDQKDLEEGLEVIERALAIDPDLETALLLRGHALWELGREEEARRDWRRALELNPTCRPATEWLENGPPRQTRTDDQD